MSKLFKLKEWLTLDETANHLSMLLGEEVLLKDIYRLVLDRHLTLSVHFVNHTYVHQGKIIGLDEVDWLSVEAGGLLLKLIKDDNIANEFIVPLQWGDNKFLKLDKNIQTVGDVWDLTLKGAETLDIEHYYQMAVGGPPVTLGSLSGVFVRCGDVVCQLMESFDNNEFVKGSMAAKEKIEARIHTDQLSKDEANILIEAFEKDREVYLENRRNSPREEDYYPAGSLPNDSVLVVRTAAIIEFLDSIDDAPKKLDKPLTTKERNSMLTLIAALCGEEKIDYNKRGVAGALAKSTEILGSSLSEDTIRNILKQVKEKHN